MELARVFQAVEETRFLNQLSSLDRLFLIGEAEALEYIKSFMARRKPSDNNCYYDLSANSVDDLSAIAFDKDYYRGVIVVSVKDETSLFQEVKSKLDRLDIDLPVLRLFADIFINVVCRQKLLRQTLDLDPKPSVSYAVFATPRSGSTYFCHLLGSTNVAGYPSEHLRLATQELAKHCNFDYLRLLYNLMEHRVTSNGVFGTKFISHFLFELQPIKPYFSQVLQSFDKSIILVRKDKIAQAVSLVLAQKTEVWHIQSSDSDQSANYRSYKSRLEDIQINDELLSEVEQKTKVVQNQEARLKKILDRNQIKPLEVVYEEVMENTASQIDRVLKFLNIAPSETALNLNSGVKKMPSNLSQEIIRQYKNKKSIVC